MDGEIYDLTDPPALNRYENHDIAVVVDRLVVKRRIGIAWRIRWRPRCGPPGGWWRWWSTRARSADSHLFSERYACANCGISLPELEPRQFSFNSPYGACEECGGLGTRKEVNPELMVSDPSLSILEGVILPWGEPSGHVRNSVLPGLAQAYEFDPKDPWGTLPERSRRPFSTDPGR